MRITAKMECWPRDWRVGLAWKTGLADSDYGELRNATDIWICLLPCLPIHVTIWRKWVDTRPERRATGDRE